MFWDGSTWVDETPKPTPTPTLAPQHRRWRDRSATGLMGLILVGLIIPSVGVFASSGGSGVASWSTDYRVTTVQENSSSIDYNGHWTRIDYSGYSAGRARSTDQLGAGATFTFKGTAIAWIGPGRTHPRCGQGLRRRQLREDGRHLRVALRRVRGALRPGLRRPRDPQRPVRRPGDRRSSDRGARQVHRPRRVQGAVGRRRRAGHAASGHPPPHHDRRWPRPTSPQPIRVDLRPPMPPRRLPRPSAPDRRSDRSDPDRPAREHARHRVR